MAVRPPHLATHFLLSTRFFASLWNKVGRAPSWNQPECPPSGRRLSLVACFRLNRLAGCGGAAVSSPKPALAGGRDRVVAQSTYWADVSSRTFLGTTAARRTFFLFVTETQHASQEHPSREHGGNRRSSLNFLRHRCACAVRTTRGSAACAPAESKCVFAGQRYPALERNHREPTTRRSTFRIERCDLSAGRRRSGHFGAPGQWRPHASDSTARNSRR